MWSKLSVFMCCVTLIGLTHGQYEVENCPVEDSTFELVTGWMYSSPQDILETRAGTLQLAECIDACKTNQSCLAINFETGLCVLFKSQVKDKTETLIKSQFPVFTMYAQKQCIPSARSCQRAWGFELVRGYYIKNGGRKQMQLPSRLACMDACIQERQFPCRSAWWDVSKLECTMSDLDRYSLDQQLSRFQPVENVEFMESQCVAEPSKMCEFKKIENRLLKTVDSLHEGVASVEECRQLCLDAPFRCHTFDFEGVCRLSHHSQATVSLVEEPYLTMNHSVSYERGACYNVTLDCQANHLVARLATNKIFNGKVYARHRPNSCVLDVKQSMTFEMEMEYADPACGIRQEEPGRFATDLVLQHHDQIMTSADMGFALRCSFHLENRSVAHGIELQVSGHINPMGSESAVVPSPNVSMRITDRAGADITTAQVGDALSLRFEITDQTSPYEIFVRELVAMDGTDGAEIVLIDSRGCPTDPSIMGPVTQVYKHGKVLQAFFEAFKFPTSDVVQFQSLVTPCLPSCQPVDCSVAADPSTGGTLQAQSYGRRKRRSVAGNGTQVDNLLVMNSIRISDRFNFQENSTLNGDEWEGGEWEVSSSRSVSGQCLNFASFVVCCAFLVILQVAIICAWMCIWKRKQNQKSLYPEPTPTSHYFYQPSIHHPGNYTNHKYYASDMAALPRLA